jgi:ribosome-binding factor A
VGEEIRHALAWIVERGEIRDPRLAGVPITVTEVRLGPDLRNATVFVIPLGGLDAAAVVDALDNIKPFLRRRIAQEVRLKYVPGLTFVADISFDRADHVRHLLRDPEVARDLSEDGNDGRQED